MENGGFGMENTYLTKKDVIQINEDTFIVTFNEKFKFDEGQFIMIQTPSLTRKPFILGTWEDNIAVSVQIKGKGTNYIVFQGEKFKAHYPLGNKFIPPAGKGIVIASPTCITLANLLHEKYSCNVLIGSKSKINLELPFESVVGNEDFSKKIKTLKTYDWYLVSGSKQMEEFVLSNIESKNVFVSLEEYMGCGIGACKSCAVFTKDGVKHVCTDGPIFRRDML
jgi:dihydroorotate dehydrogenase electron transfer subunit